MSQKEEGAIIGIDLGTTYSLVAVLEGGQPIIIANALGEQLTPSAVSVDEAGMVLVGAPAAARAKTHPERTATQFKRDMGTDRVFTLGPRKLGPQQLSALVLAELKRDAEAWLGRPVTEAVITVPAYFGDPQRQATRDAGELAGLKVERIINEPTAAAMAYGLHNRHRELKAVVLDLGGGTFDVTVLEIIEGVIEVQASAGDARLGGEDFTDALMVLVEQQLARQGEDVSEVPLARARIRDACELAKRRLSTEEVAEIALPGLPLAGGRRADVAMNLSRADAQEVWAPLLDRIRIPVMRALRDARIKTTEIDEVLLVGGSTRLPCVVELSARLFGRMPLRKLPPDEAVVMGAAVQAALKRDDEAVDDMSGHRRGPVHPRHLHRAAHRRPAHQRPLRPSWSAAPSSPPAASRVQHHRGQPARDPHPGLPGRALPLRRQHPLSGYASRAAPVQGRETSVDVRFTHDQNGFSRSR
ncbi:MAG: Hsp70 family protein [bacterium]